MRYDDQRTSVSLDGSDEHDRIARRSRRNFLAVVLPSIILLVERSSASQIPQSWVITVLSEPIRQVGTDAARGSLSPLGQPLLIGLRSEHLICQRVKE